MSKKVKIIEVTTATCGICKAIAPMISKLVERFGDVVDFEKQEVNFDADIVQKYNIFNGDMLIDRHSGGISAPDFIKKITDNFNKING